MNKREFTKQLREYRKDLKISTKEITYFYNVYKDIIRLAKEQPDRFDDIKKTYRYSHINVLKFRNLLCSHLYIELTPRQAELYIDVITLVLSDRNKNK
jgi:hypothetical protein